MRSVWAAQAKGTEEGRHAYAAARGVILSHLIGLSFFVAFLLDRAVQFELPYTRFVDIPIRLIAIWLILDRVGRFRRVRANVWDFVHLTFAAGYAFVLIYAEVYMTRDTGLINYIQWLSFTFAAYVYFLVVREGTARRGFNPEIVMRWMVVTLGLVCVVALLQALDLGGMRQYINDFYRQRQAEMRMQGPSAPWQARAPTIHANSLAILLVVGFSVFFGIANYRKLKWYDFGVGMLMIVTLFATYSRIGMVSAVLVALSIIFLLFVQRKFYQGTVGLFAFVSLLALFVVSVHVFDIQRYKVLVEGEGMVRNAESAAVSGWYQRQEAIRKALDLAGRYPITGVNAATSALNQEFVLMHNAYTFEGLLLNVYLFAPVSYGLIGVFFLVGIFWTTLSQIRYVNTRLAFAPATFIAGMALVATGIAENVIFVNHAMITVNILVALALAKVQKPAETRLALPEPPEDERIGRPTAAPAT